MEDATVALGSRKHLFIDLTLVERRDHVELRVNPPRLGAWQSRETEPGNTTCTT